MYRSPLSLRSGSKGQPVALTAADKHPDSPSTAPASTVDPSTMPADKTSAAAKPVIDTSVIDRYVSNYLSGEEVFDKLITKLSQKMKAVVEEAVTTALATFHEQLAELKEEVSSMKEEMHTLKERLDDRTDELEQYQRRDNIRIFGLEEKRSEDTDALVVALCREKLHLDLPISAICRSHRVGKMPAPAEDGRKLHRPIIVRFVSYRDRQAVFQAKKNLKASGITIKEDLTKRRMAVYREAVTQHGVRNTWTLDGRVYWVDSTGKKGAATRLAELTTPAST